MSQALPERWRQAVKRRFFTRRIDRRPCWPADKRRRVIWEIADDVHTFLQFYGQPTSYWKLE